SGIHKGEFRTQDLIYIVGEERKDTIYKENGIRLLINPETVYFSSKLSTEREKLMEKIKDNSNVLVMFSGSGPYSFVALKKNPNLGRIVSVEINPEGHKYALKSLDLNKNLLKKSKLFIDLIKFLRENNLPIFEKLLIKNLNSLKISFINEDVKKWAFGESKIEEIELENYNWNNELFLKSNCEIYNFLLNNSNDKDDEDNNKSVLNLNLDEINKELFSKYFILFFDKYNFICKINGKIYLFDNLEKKSLLFLFLNGRDFLNLEKYDEIFMPLPKDASSFLNCVFQVVNKKCIVHLYDFLNEEEFPKKSEKVVLDAGKKFGRKVNIISTRKVGQYAPGKYRVCCDFEVLE
ncbi:MAG: hypothetical protein KC550_00770, partial [Nanoarchaeota archaeon]|nr:hypothetical protein [Nanoarchaeota archaeon]